MAKKGDFREIVIGFLQTSLRELHQASMYAQGVAHTDVLRLVKGAEQLKERLTKEMSEDLIQDREDAKRKAALMKSRRDTALANHAKNRKAK